MRINWTALEARIHRQLVSAVAEFARRHGRERFYGFALTTRDDGLIRLSANTPESFRAECRSRDRKIYGPAAGERRAGALDELKWDTGAWLYCAFNCERGPLYDISWYGLQLSFLESCQSLDNGQVVAAADKFVALCFRVLIRTARDRLYDCLNRTKDFKLLGEDYNDPDGLRGSRRKMRRALRENKAKDLASNFALNVGD